MNDIDSPDFWDSVYRQGMTGWDLGGPTPVFGRLVRAGEFPPGRMIVLGAGRGHDARLFARYGFEVTAIDFSPEAVEAMETLADPDAPVKAFRADLFDLPEHFTGAFDYILEYVFYCAIQPARRRDYAAVAAKILRPGGFFLGLLFPLDDRPGGPPFTVSVDGLVDLLEPYGFELVRREIPPDSVKPRRGKEELVVLRKRE